MRRVVLRGLLARKLRLALTATAVALGVMLIAGTYVFTDTINASFDRIFTTAYARTDVVLSPSSNLADDDSEQPSLPASLLGRVRATPGVQRADGSLFDQSISILGRDGKPVSRGAPNFAATRTASYEPAQGRFPRSADEVALDKATADRKGFRVGQAIRITGRAGVRRYRIAGIVRFSGVDSFGGASVALLTLPEAQRLTGKRGRFDEIDVTAAPGVAPAALTRRLRRQVPATVEVRTGGQEASKQSSDIRDQLGFLQTALLAFAGISLFVGAFIIFNTSSITVAQRGREFALLRTLGASRGQVLRSVLGEGLVLGLLGSLVGLGLGVVVASGLKALFGAVGVDLPSDGTVLETRTVVVALVVGVVVTLLASLAPARRATRVAPVAALREGVALPEDRASRLAFPAALVLGAIGLALMVVGLFAVSDTDTALALLGAGAALTFLGVALLSPRLVAPLASVIGRPMERAAGVTGRLARENTVRQPGRTAITASALMVGVALVTFASVFAASAKTTVDRAVDTGLAGQVVVQDTDGFSSFPNGAARTVAGVDGVQRVAELRFGETRVGTERSTTQLTGVDPATFSLLWTVSGGDAFQALDERSAVLSRAYARDKGLRVGSRLRLATPARGSVEVKVIGLVDDQAHLTGKVTVSTRLLQRSFGVRDDAFLLVGSDPSADPGATKARIDAALKGRFPQTEALTAQEFKDDQAGQVDQLLGLIYALLALSIIVSLFGIVNTLVLSITERTRELGMLRAIGTSRWQVRRMIALESVITAAIGAVLGLVLGVVLAVLVAQAVDDLVLHVPLGTIAVLLVLAGLAGVLAAVLPARRAARLDVLVALAHE